ncbi:MAG: RluA family pseudouridine synthase [Clostridiales bacterium]|jgi:23S rRNA pseudouridine1911/1915/1917 synthase|nr:RluA family pseudouridine synthase [Clostridiales bacterium]
MEKQVIIVDEDDRERIDSYLAEKLENVSRSMVQKHIASGNVLLNGKQVKPRQLVSAGDIIEVTIPEPQPCEILPENIPLDIIYQDEYIAVINKQAGLSVHPANGVYSGTLVNALLYQIKDLSSIGGVVRPGIVHRIDKNTTGLLVVAKNDEAHISLSRQIAEKSCRRIYRGITEGVIKQDSGAIIAPIGRSPSDRKKMAVVHSGKYAETHYKVLQRFKENTYAEFELKSGRTHQIRVHLRHIGHPIVGDEVYGYSKQRFKLNSHLLHAYKLILRHPKSGQLMEFTAPLPEEFEKILSILR